VTQNRIGLNIRHLAVRVKNVMIGKYRRDQRPISAALWAIGGAIDLRSAPVQDVGGDHRCSEFLDVRILEPSLSRGVVKAQVA